MSAPVQFIERDGKREYAVVPIDTYLELLEKAEMLEDIRDAEQAMRELENGEDELIPGEMVGRLLDGEPPVRVWREHRGLTQAQLAERAGVTQGAVAQIESGKRRGSVDLLRKKAEMFSPSLEQRPVVVEGEIDNGLWHQVMLHCAPPPVG